MSSSKVKSNIIIREVESPHIRDFVRFVPKGAGEEGVMGGDNALSNILFTGSGKGAIALVLKYLVARKIIRNKLDEIMVADWVGYWVYNQIQPFAFPAKRYSDRTRAILVYHQYGFPQNMDEILNFARDRNLLVIEDCAHAPDSYYNGKLVGSFGDFSIYSFSKWVFCLALGGVKAKPEDFSAFSRAIISDSPFAATLIKDTAKLLYEYSSFTKLNTLKKYAGLFLNMSYAIYGEALKPGGAAVRMLFSKIGMELNTRRHRYRYFRSETDHLGICDHLEPEGVVPYVIPIICPEAKRESLLNFLRTEGIVTGLYNFDINRSILSPRFMQCIWVPCHSGIPDEKFADTIKAIRKIL